MAPTTTLPTFPPYRTLSPLASGGMAELYLGVHPDTPSQRVVIKTLRHYLQWDREMNAMFLDEIDLMQRLSHPGVVAALDAAPQHQPPYLVLEYVPGCDLSHLLKSLITKAFSLPLDVALTIVTQLLDTLVYLHELITPTGAPMHLVHRDLSPPNILLREDGLVKLTDFGIALHATMARQSSGDEIKGKFSYLPPELLNGLPLDQRADLFSWGVLSWELLAGRRLFRGEHPEQTLDLLRDAPIPPLQDLRPDLPPAFVSLFHQVLRRKREQRPDSTLAARRSLQHTLQQQPSLYNTQAVADFLAEHLRHLRPDPLTASRLKEHSS